MAHRIKAENPLDRHDTPVAIAEAMADAVQWRDDAAGVFADVAAGSGVLLEAVARRFPRATITAGDIDPTAVAKLKIDHPYWQITEGDFLARANSARPSGDGPDVIVLNPPFSCRGARVVESRSFGAVITSSIAAAFLLRALEVVPSERGQVCALMPAGSMSSEKDEAAWDLLRQHADVTVVARFGRNEFKGAFASVHLVRLDRLGIPRDLTASAWQANLNRDAPLTLYRGRFPIHRAQIHGVPLVHTTTIRDGVVSTHPVHRAPPEYAVAGPLVIFQRVGLPDRRKVAFLESEANVALSDCVFALSGAAADLIKARETISQNWSRFEEAFGGSCAPFATVSTVEQRLCALGLRLVIEPRLEGLSLARRHDVKTSGGRPPDPAVRRGSRLGSEEASLRASASFRQT